MKNLKIIFYLCLICSASFAQKKYNHIALFGGTAHLGNGKIIENSIIAVNNGKFEMVSSAKGLKLAPNNYDTVIYLEGKHIYPAIINVNNILGLHDAEMVRAATKIQKTFRGYITRKYINEAKYIITKVKIIQAWWRRTLKNRKEKLQQKIASSSNSLITIKDFNDTMAATKNTDKEVTGKVASKNVSRKKIQIVYFPQVSMQRGLCKDTDECSKHQ